MWFFLWSHSQRMAVLTKHINLRRNSNLHLLKSMEKRVTLPIHRKPTLLPPPFLSSSNLIFCMFWWPTFPPLSPLLMLSSKEAASFLPFVLTLVQSFSAFSFSSSPSDTIFLCPFSDSQLQSSKNQSWRNSLFSDVGDR